MRVDDEEELLTDLAVVAHGAEATVSSVSQNTFYPDAVWDLAVRVPALAGMDQRLNGLLERGILTSLQAREQMRVIPQ